MHVWTVLARLQFLSTNAALSEKHEGGLTACARNAFLSEEHRGRLTACVRIWKYRWLRNAMTTLESLKKSTVTGARRYEASQTYEKKSSDHGKVARNYQARSYCINYKRAQPPLLHRSFYLAQNAYLRQG